MLNFYGRRVEVAAVEVPLAFKAFCFSLYFLALTRCLCQATFLVLFIIASPVSNVDTALDA